MFDEAARAVLSKPLVARLATHGKNGYPHLVPLWFLLEGDLILMISERDTGKVRNLLADPRAALQVGGENEAGYLIRGEVEVLPDTEHTITKRITRFYEAPEEAEKHLAEWTQWDMVYLKLTPKSVVKVY